MNISVKWKLTQKEWDWILTRIDENNIGRTIVKSHLINKFRKFTNDYTTKNIIIRTSIIDKYTEHSFGNIEVID